MDKIPLRNVESRRPERKSCFYELGAKKSAAFGAYSERPVSPLIQRIRDYKAG